MLQEWFNYHYITCSFHFSTKYFPYLVTKQNKKSKLLLLLLLIIIIMPQFLVSGIIKISARQWHFHFWIWSTLMCQLLEKSSRYHYPSMSRYLDISSKVLLVKLESDCTPWRRRRKAQQRLSSHLPDTFRANMVLVNSYEHIKDYSYINALICYALIFIHSVLGGGGTILLNTS